MKITDLPDEVCLACGNPLPENTRSNRKYCSTRCRRWYYGTHETATIRRSKRGRTCAICTAPMSVELKATAIYCSIDCRRTAVLYRKLAPGRPCARCGKPVSGKRMWAVTCSEACRYALASAHTPPRYSRPIIPCAWCGKPFFRKRKSNACCSRSCAARLRRSRRSNAPNQRTSQSPRR